MGAFYFSLFLINIYGVIFHNIMCMYTGNGLRLLAVYHQVFIEH